VAISSIEIGERRRVKLGLITNLAASIEQNGLIHPIVITEGNLLVVGRRRLAAFQKLNRRKIPARRFERMSPEERRELELDENTKRENLSDHEMSKLRMREIEEAEAEALGVQSAQLKKPGAGRGSKGGDSEVARKLGTTREEIRRTRKHVETADEHPVFKGNDWSRGRVLEARKSLDKIPEAFVPMAVDMISEVGVPPEVAVEMLDTFAETPPKQLKQIEKLYRSDDEEDQMLAKTQAAKRPPPPPHRLPWLREAISLVEKCVKDKIPTGNEDLRSALALVKGVLKSSEDEHKKARRAAGGA
jgi:hypothetical protein